MSAKQLKTFADLYSAVLEEVKIQSTDTTNLNRVKRDLNIVYLNHVLPKKPWYWARKNVDIIAPAYYATGTVSVTNSSSSVTLSTGSALSRQGWLISIDGYSEVYKIKSHTAAGTAIVLESNFTGDTASGKSFKIWPDGLPLPVDLFSTYKVWNDHFDSPMESLGDQDFLALKMSSAFKEGRPQFFRVTEPVDPSAYETIASLPASASRSSAGNIRTVVFSSTVAAYLEVGDRVRISSAGNENYNVESVIYSVSTTTVKYVATSELTESSTVDTGIVMTLLDSYETDQTFRKLEVFPALYTKQTTIHIEGLRNIMPMEDDNDEPAMAVVDRDVLLYGALERAWRRMRNPEEAKANRDLYLEKLNNMAAKIQDSTDFPRIQMNQLYMASKYNRKRRKFTNF